MPPTGQKRFDLDRDELPPEETQPNKTIQPGKRLKRQKREFIGAVPWDQFLLAAKLPGKSPLVVWLLIRHRVALRRDQATEITLTDVLVAKCGLSDRTKIVAIKQLEHAGLIQVTRPGNGKAWLLSPVMLPENEED
jgi:hypothetical protein